jgi:hypothetical protein
MHIEILLDKAPLCEKPSRAAFRRPGNSRVFPDCENHSAADSRNQEGDVAIVQQTLKPAA